MKQLRNKAKSIETARAKKILDALKQGELSAPSIVRATGLSLRPVDRTLRALTKRNMIVSRVELASDRKQPPRVFYRLNDS